MYIETLWREKLITTYTVKNFYNFSRLHYHYCSPWVPGGVSNFRTLAKRGFYLATVNLGKKKDLIKKQQLIQFQEVSRTLQVPTLFFGAASLSAYKEAFAISLDMLYAIDSDYLGLKGDLVIGTNTTPTTIKKLLILLRVAIVKAKSRRALFFTKKT